MPNQPPLNPDALEAAADAVTMAAGACGVELYGADEDIFAERAVSAYLAAALPEVTSVEELEALPVQSVIEDVDGCIFEIIHNGERNRDGTFYREYVMTGDVHSYSIDEIDLPATVLKRAPETPRR